ncbi:MAG TPA: hypothetical protein PLK80_18555 [bacterium]|nr:hypothetical protein [bacterium]
MPGRHLIVGSGRFDRNGKQSSYRELTKLETVLVERGGNVQRRHSVVNYPIARLSGAKSRV